MQPFELLNIDITNADELPAQAHAIQITVSNEITHMPFGAVPIFG